MELLAQGHKGETLRLALLSAQYRQPLSWTDDVLAQARTNLDRLYRLAGDAEPTEPDDAVVEALSDDLNTPLALTRLIASPRTFNLVVSNIPGPRVPMWMMGCELQESYPVVPLAERHAVSIGVTTVGEGAYFGVYADRKALPDADVLACAVNDAIDELLELCPAQPAPGNGGRRGDGSNRHARADGRPQPQPV